MDTITNTPVPELLLKHIQLSFAEASSKSRLRKPIRIKEFVTILQHIANGRSLSTRQLAKVHNLKNRYHNQKLSSRTTMSRRIQQLVEIGMIKRIKEHYFNLDDQEGGKHEAAHYALTEDAMMLMLQSDRGYSSISDMKKRSHPVYRRDYRPTFPPTPKIKSESKKLKRGCKPKAIAPELTPAEIKQHVLDMDTGRDDYLPFLQGLKHLEQIPFVILKQNALFTLNKAGKAAGIRNLPSDSFKFIHKLLATGRVQNVPYVYHGNSLLRFTRPAYDIHLEHGVMVYLDYGTQEIRLLAHQSQDSNLLSAVMYEPDLNAYFQEEVFKDASKSLSKTLRSAISYGSKGYGKELLETTIQFMKESNLSGNPKHLIRKYFKAFTEMFPDVEVYREEVAQEWLSDGIIIAPGGIKRGFDDELLKNDGTPSISELRKKGLSHLVQGMGAWIARKIIADSVNLKHAQLLIPVHDGFIFYLPNENMAEAYSEARSLMERAACEVVPVPMPHKIEWVWGQNGPINVYDFESRFKHNDSGTITAVINVQIPQNEIASFH
jgi:hypothetical protein